MDPTVSIQEASAITNHPTDGRGKAYCCSETNVGHLVAAGVEWVKAEGVKLMATCTPAVEHDRRMILEFWGVRGGLPPPGTATVRYFLRRATLRSAFVHPRRRQWIAGVRPHA